MSNRTVGPPATPRPRSAAAAPACGQLVVKAPEVERLALPPAELGEGAIRCDRRRCLWWVDVGRSELHRFDPANGRNERRRMPGHVGCATLTEGDDLIVVLPGGLHRFSPDTGELEHLADLPGEQEENCPNDGAVSRSGRFHIGTMSMEDRSCPNGRLHVLDGARVTCWLTGLHVANGLAFSPIERVGV